MREPLWDPELAFILGGQLYRNVLPKGGRALADVHRHIEHCALGHAHQLTLRLLDLVVQSTQDILHRLAVVVLHEADLAADGLLEVRLVEALVEEAPVVTKLGSMINTSGMAVLMTFMLTILP